MGRRRGTFGVFGWAKRKASVARHKVPLCHSYRRALRFEPLEERRVLAVVTASNLSDVVNGDTSSIAALMTANGGDGISLREAILAANADAAADTIDFAVTGTIQLTSIGHVGELAVTNNLTINGPGSDRLTIKAFAGTTSSGDGARIFRVDDGGATLKDVFIEGVTFTGGDRTLLTDGADGGAILNKENLRLTACTISGNRLSGGSGKGGGIFSQLGNLTVTASTVSGNTGGRGGGIYAAGVGTTIRDSTLSGNSSYTSSGGGGGIAFGNVAGSVNTIINCTISGNYASSSNGGGILNASTGSLAVRHSTVTLNRVNGSGGGVHSNFATTSLDHTIVAGNFLASTTTRTDVGGSATSVRYGLIGVNTGATITDNGGNQIGTKASPIDALLAPLADNAGPTFTHALLAGSPAIDGGDPTAVAGLGTVPLQDQRESIFVRIADGDGNGSARIDIGAYERQILPDLNLMVDTLADEIDHNYSAGDLSLREAIDLANGSVGTDTISFAAALTSGGPATIPLGSSEMRISDSLTINGPGAKLLTISAFDPTPAMKNGDGGRVFNLDDANANNATNVSINGLTLTGGDTSGSGGAILANDNLTLSDSVITGNACANPYAAQGGGGVNSGYGGNLTLVRCVIANNSTVIEGGGIRKRGAQLVVLDSQIEGNAAWSGGGISAADGVTVEILRSSISSNASYSTSYYGGGGLLLYSANVDIRDSLISGNSSLFVGGGIDAFASRSFVMIGSTVSGNTSGSNGGALRLFSSNTWEIASSTITANVAPEGSTGGVYVTGVNAASRVFRSNIIAGNADSDVDGDATLFQSAGYNLIGTGSAIAAFNQTGDQTGVANPMVAPLADNGGPTWTHALLPGSLALDAGDPAATAGVNGVPLYDQRGIPFGRVFDGDGVGGARIDIGAFESQPIPPVAMGDYSVDGKTDAADYVVWRKTVGASVTPFSGADGDGDGVIGQGDYGVWRAHFGAGGVGLGAGEIANGELGVGSGEGGASKVEGRGSSAGALVQASSLSSGEMAGGARGAMPVSERLAYVAASLRDADESVGGVASVGGQAGVALTSATQPKTTTEGALAESGARAAVGNGEWGMGNAGYAAATGAVRDAGLVAWLISRGRERNGDRDNWGDCVGSDERDESSSLEFADALFTALDEPSPSPSLTGRGISSVLPRA